MSRKKPHRQPAPIASPKEPSPDDAPGVGGRRRLLNWIWGGLLVLFSMEAAWVAASFLRPRRGRSPDDSAVIIAGPVERFAPQSVTAFPNGPFYLARLADGGFLALDRTCTHLGCTVPWEADQGRFVCPCHASSFDITGAVLAPPAPRPLDLYPVRVENGVVKVDTGRRVRRDAYVPGQEARS